MLTHYSANIAAILQSILRRTTRYQPTEGIVHAVDGNRVDLRLMGSTTILRNVAVIGDVETLVPGQSIPLRWEFDRPVAIATTDLGTIPFEVTVQADNDTLENSPLGIRVKAGGIRLWHLAFTPSLEGHTHEDIFQRHAPGFLFYVLFFPCIV